MNKADKLGDSAAFGAASRPASARRQLIAQAAGEAPADPARVPIEQLEGNPDNSRDDLGDLEELANSLREHGLRQPVAVMPRRAFLEVYPQHEAAVGQAAFIVVNGNRRLAAARLAGLQTLAVHLPGGEDGDVSSVRVAALVENIHRKNLEPLEEARAVAELVQLHGSQAEVARRLGKTSAWVSQRLALLKLTPELQEELRDGELKVKEARQLGTLPADEQMAARQAAVNPVNGRGGSQGDAGEAPTVNPVKGPGRSQPSAAPVPAAQGSSGGSSSSGPTPSPQEQGEQLMLDPTWEISRMGERLQASLTDEQLTALAEDLLGRIGK